MEKLASVYQTQLDNIKATIQNSDLLSAYLDTEESEDYKALAEHFEPQIQELYIKVADHHPLQLEALEEQLLDNGFEGLYIPKVLGYAVLRGHVNDKTKYSRPQNHFKKILQAIVSSSNFEMISQRTGQSIQIGFALSSDIWITNFLNGIENKKVKYFLQSQKLEKYRNQGKRKAGLYNYRRQFQSLNYQSTSFPSEPSELVVLAPSVKDFLIFRSHKNYDNSSLNNYLKEFITNEKFRNMNEFLELLMIIGFYMKMDDELSGLFTKAFNSVRSSNPGFEQVFFKNLREVQEGSFPPGIEEDKKFSALVDKSLDGEVSNYFTLTDTIHGKGYINEEAIDAVRVYYDSHEGRSIQNECVRASIFNYFSGFLNNLEPEAYHDYFEMNKVFTQYMGIFSNQKFNQDLKDLSLKYVKKLIKRFTDKRGKDYQDIKKWVRTTFIDLSFMKEKELVELFKTRRKKKVAV
ncbi:MAG: hypothetical protein HKN68_04545 [Saprospiraceae bacterium]|nr:hypothetical protein [Saprospiraceae bacterium]